MLQEDLVTAVKAYLHEKDHPVSDLEKFLTSIGDDAERSDRRLLEIVKKSLNDTE